MNWSSVVTVYAKELKDSLRDRRALISIIVIPTFVMPALMFAVIKVAMKVEAKAREEIPTVMVLSSEDSPTVVAALRAAPTMRVVPANENYQQLISDKKIRAAVKLPAGFEAALKADTAEPVQILYYAGEPKSKMAADELDKFFRNLRDQTVTRRLAEHQLPATLIKPFEVRRENVAPPEKVGGNQVGGFVPYLIIVLCFTGAMYPAMDLTAGEKERGTMETLLCSPVNRVDIVLGKFLMVLTGSLGAMLLALISMSLSFVVIGTSIMDARPAKMAAAAAQSSPVLPTIDPLGLVGMLAMVFPVAVLFSAVVFTVALFAKTYKEAQSYIAPMTFVVILPAVIGMLPGIDLNLRLAFVPLLNLSLVSKEMLSGVWHWDYIAIIFGSSCVYAGAALMLAVRMFNREDVIFRT